MPATGTITTHESGSDFVVEWQIHGFSTLRKDDGAEYCSPSFSFGGQRWFLKIFPNGRSRWNSYGHVDLRLVKYLSGRSIKMSVSLSLKTAKGERHKEQHATREFGKYSPQNYHELLRFISRSELTRLRSDLLPDDVLTVVCTMKGRSSAGSENHNCREKLLMALCIASIIIAVVTGCVLAYSKTPLSSSHPGREAVIIIETAEINNTVNESKLEGSSSNEIVATDVSKSDEVNKTDGSTLIARLDAELNKADQSEIDGSDNPAVSVANQADTDETDKSEGASKIQTSVNNRSDVVGSNEFEASGSNDTSAIDIKEDGDINKTLAAEMNEIDNSEIAASDISETFATNQADSAEKDESDHNLPKDHEKQLVLYAAAIIILVIAIACVHHYSKTSLSAMHAYGEDNLEQNSENIYMELCTQMAEENENSKRICMNASTQTGEENAEERDWMTDVLDFLKAGNGIDVTFEVESPNGHVEFFAHKLILAMRSPFFADEFYGEGKSDAHLVIPLKGINPKAFMEMLRYCYDNKPRMRTIEEACVLFKVASDFKILNLQKLCHAFIRDAKVDS